FVRNLQDGNRAVVLPATDSAWAGSPEGYVEVPKGRGETKFRYLTLRLKGVAPDVVQAVTAYLPPLFKLDPGMIDREAVRFVVLTSRAWIGLMLDPEAQPDPALHSGQAPAGQGRRHPVILAGA